MEQTVVGMEYDMESSSSSRRPSPAPGETGTKFSSTTVLFWQRERHFFGNANDTIRSQCHQESLSSPCRDGGGELAASSSTFGRILGIGSGGPT